MISAVNFARTMVSNALFQEADTMPGRAKFETDDSESIGERLTEVRKAKGMTQVELAERLGITQAAVSAYERGEARLTAPVLLRLAKILGATTDEIIGVKTFGDEKRRLSRRILRRAEQIESLPNRDQQALLRTIDAFLKAAVS